GLAARPSARTSATYRPERQPLPQRGRARALRLRLDLPEDRQHPNHRRPRAEDRGRAAEDEELRQEVAQRDQDDSRRDGPLARHAARPRGARAPARPVRARLRGLENRRGPRRPPPRPPPEQVARAEPALER